MLEQVIKWSKQFWNSKSQGECHGIFRLFTHNLVLSIWNMKYEKCTAVIIRQEKLTQWTLCLCTMIWIERRVKLYANWIDFCQLDPRFFQSRLFKYTYQNTKAFTKNCNWAPQLLMPAMMRGACLKGSCIDS